MNRESDVKAKVQSQFGKAAAEYVASKGHAQGSDLALLREWIAPESDWIALDVATGGGHVAKTLAPHVRTVYATDLTKQMLEAAQAHLLQEGLSNVHYIVADAEALPFLDNTFDVVTCRIAPHHFPNPDRFVREVARVLKPDGRFLFIDNVAPDKADLADYMNTFERLRDESHVRCLSVTEWKEWMNQSGLRICRSRTRRKTYDFADWAGRMIKSERALQKLEAYIISETDAIKGYFTIYVEGGRVHSLEVDEWMAICSKDTQHR